MRPDVKVEVYRVPFLLEPEYYFERKVGFKEGHYTRMTRKFGSVANFERVKVQQALVARGRQAGLLDEVYGGEDAEGGSWWADEKLDNRVQSETVTSHRAVAFVSKKYGCDLSETFHFALAFQHFGRAGELGDKILLVKCFAQSVTADDGQVQEFKDFLDSDKGVDGVVKTLEALDELGIHSIPQLVVHGRVIGGTTADLLAAVARVESGDHKGMSFYGTLTEGL